MMTDTTKQLAVLEEVAGVIDVDGYVFTQASKYDEGSPWWYRDINWAARKLPFDIALAIRLQQAMEWIAQWCKEQEDAEGHRELSTNYCVFADGEVHIAVGLQKCIGKSWAEALVAMVKKLDAMYEEQDDD